MNDLVKKSVEQIKSEIDNIVSQEYKLTNTYQKAINKISEDFFLFNYNLSQFIAGKFKFCGAMERCFQVNEFIYIPNIPWNDTVMRFNNRIIIENKNPLGLSISCGSPYSNFYLEDNYYDASDFRVYTQIPDLDNTIGTYLFKNLKSLYIQNEKTIKNNIELLKSFNDLLLMLSKAQITPDFIFDKRYYFTIEEMIINIKNNKEVLLITHDLDISSHISTLEEICLYEIKNNDKIKMI